MPDLDHFRIIKWILIVLLAGFIGQFGKSFAKHLMERSWLKKKERATKIDVTTSTGDLKHPEEAHRAVETHSVHMSPEEKAKQDKKLAKTLAKQKKKEVKALKKQADS